MVKEVVSDDTQPPGMSGEHWTEPPRRCNHGCTPTRLPAWALLLVGQRGLEGGPFPRWQVPELEVGQGRAAQQATGQLDSVGPAQVDRCCGGVSCHGCSAPPPRVYVKECDPTPPDT